MEVTWNKADQRRSEQLEQLMEHARDEHDQWLAAWVLRGGGRARLGVGRARRGLKVSLLELVNPPAHGFERHMSA